MKRLTIFSGHYGSGKTNIAVNYALDMKKAGYDTVIADLDIVNPYFRTADSLDELTEAGIELISLPYANSNVDLPAIPSQIYGLVQRYDRHAVIDLGGDDRGALALGRFAPYILQENDYDMFLVVNFYRPLTTTPEEALEVVREIEAVTTLKFTGIVNNSNLGAETDAETILCTVPMAEELGRLTGLPVAFTCAEEGLIRETGLEGMMPLRLQKKYY